jgi:hypothetical protein
MRRSSFASSSKTLIPPPRMVGAGVMEHSFRKVLVINLALISYRHEATCCEIMYNVRFNQNKLSIKISNLQRNHRRQIGLE